MSALLLFAIVLLASLAMGLLRVRLGPSTSDCMLAAHLTTTTGVGFLVLMALVLETNALLDVALVLALLTSIASIAFVRLRPESTSEDGM